MRRLPEALAKLAVRAAVARHAQVGIADAVERNEQPDAREVSGLGPALGETAAAEPAQLALVAAAVAESPLALEPDELDRVGKRAAREHARDLEQQRGARRAVVRADERIAVVRPAVVGRDEHDAIGRAPGSTATRWVSASGPKPFDSTVVDSVSTAIPDTPSRVVIRSRAAAAPSDPSARGAFASSSSSLHASALREVARILCLRLRLGRRTAASGENQPAAASARRSGGTEPSGFRYVKRREILRKYARII